MEVQRVALEDIEATERDAARYRWIRQRLQIRNLEFADGEVRPAFDVRIGCARVDSQHVPGSGYLSQDRFEEDCQKVDAAIDAARI